MRNLGSAVFPRRSAERGPLRLKYWSITLTLAPGILTWIPQASGMGWLIITHDRDIRYNRQERDAVMRYGGRVIIIRGQRDPRGNGTDIPGSARANHQFPWAEPGAIHRQTASGPHRDVAEPGRLDTLIQRTVPLHGRLRYKQILRQKRGHHEVRHVNHVAHLQVHRHAAYHVGLITGETPAPVAGRSCSGWRCGRPA